MNIAIVGAGYVGLVTGACFADRGHTVVCVDTDLKKVDRIKKKKSPLYEKDLNLLLERIPLKATTLYEDGIPDANIVFICVGTPLQRNKHQDLTFLKNACTEIGKHLQKQQTVVVKSSVVPGTTEDVVIPLLEKSSIYEEGKEFTVVVNPEFLREGNAVYDFINPDRIIIGSKKKSTILDDLYKEFRCQKLYTDLKTAEMIKYASNAFLATKVSFINEIGNLCKKMNIDVYEVAEGIGYDKRIGREFLNAGVGFGGSCLSKDTNALITKAKDLDEHLKLLTSALMINEHQPMKLITLLKKHLSQLKGKTIGILGLSFKPETDDIRESRSIPIIKELLKEKAHIKAYDPKAMESMKKIYPLITYCSPEEVLQSDAVLILTHWKEFDKLDYTEKIVIDGRRVEKAKTESRIYEGICW